MTKDETLAEIEGEIKEAYQKMLDSLASEHDSLLARLHENEARTKELKGGAK